MKYRYRSFILAILLCIGMSSLNSQTTPDTQELPASEGLLQTYQYNDPTGKPKPKPEPKETTDENWGCSSDPEPDPEEENRKNDLKEFEDIKIKVDETIAIEPIITDPVDEIKTGAKDEVNKTGKLENSATAGDPVRITTGEFYLQEQDFVFSRKYLSNSSGFPSFGKGWFFFADSRILRSFDSGAKQAALDLREKILVPLENNTALAKAIAIRRSECKSEYERIEALYILFKDKTETFDKQAIRAHELALKNKLSGWITMPKSWVQTGNENLVLVNPQGTPIHYVPKKIGEWIPSDPGIARHERLYSTNGKDALEADGFILESYGNCKYFYNSDGLLIKSIVPTPEGDPEIFTITRDPINGKIIKIQDTFNSSYTVEGTGQKIVSITDPLNRKIEYQQKTGNLLSVIDEEGDSISYDYKNGKLVEIIKPINASVQIRYEQIDTEGRPLVTKTFNEEKFSESFDYYPSIKKAVWTSADKEKTTIEWDEFHNTIKKTDPAGQITHYIRDKVFGDIIKEITRFGTITYKYDARGNRILTLYPDGTSEKKTYNNIDQLTSFTDRDRISTIYAWDQWGITNISIQGTQKLEIKRDTRGFLTKITEDGTIQTTIHREKNGRPEKIIKGTGKDSISQTIGWDETGRIKSIIDSDGEQISWKYAKHSITTTTADGLETEYRINARKDIVEVIERDLITKETRTLTTEYDKRHLPIKTLLNGKELSTQKWSPDGKHVSNQRGPWKEERTYSPKGYLTSITSSMNGGKGLKSIISQELTTSGSLIQIFDPTGLSTTTCYNENHQKKSHQKGNLPAETFNWTPGGRIDQVKNELGGITKWAYTNYGLQTDIYRENINLHSAIYSPNGRIKEYTDQHGSQVTVQYNTAGLVVKEIYTGGTINYEYDKTGLLNSREHRSHSNAVIESIVITRTENKRNISTSEGGLYTTVVKLNAWGESVSNTDGEGNTSTFVRDAQGRIISIIDAYGNTTQQEYNEIGKISKIIYPDKRVTFLKWDALGNLMSETDTAGIVCEYERDDAGRILSEYRRGTVVTQNSYDKNGRLSAITKGSKKDKIFNFEYLDNGHKIESKDGRGNKTSLIQDGFGQVISETDRLGYTSYIKHDIHGRPEQETDANGLKTTRIFYSDGSIIKEHTSSNEDKEIERDFLGRDIRIQNGTSKTTFTRNTASKIVSQTDSLTGTHIVFKYDKAGRLISAKGPDRDIRWRLGKMGEIVELRDLVQNMTIFFKYDSCGRETSRTFGNGIIQEKIYDNAGRLFIIRERRISGELLRAEACSYDEIGRRWLTISADGSISRFFWNDVGELIASDISVENADTSTLSRITLSEKEISTARALLDSISSGRGRILQGSQLVQSIHYDYDENGNMTSIKNIDRTTKMEYDKNNRLIQQDDTVYTWDKNGNLLEQKDLQYSLTCAYTSDNRMKTSTVIDSIANTKTSTTYGYDGYGRRVSMCDDASAPISTVYMGLGFDVYSSLPGQSLAATEYLNTGSRYRWIGESNDVRAPVSESTKNEGPLRHSTSSNYPLSLAGFPVASNVNNSPWYYSTTLTTSVASATDIFSTHISLDSIDSFGNTISTNREPYPPHFNPSDHPSFISKYRSPVTGLCNFGYRDYSPTTARFTTQDPIKDGHNWYTYCGNDPVNLVDLWGLYFGEITSNTTMQSGVGNLGNTSDTLATKGCVVAANANIINSINGNSDLTVSSFSGGSLPNIYNSTMISPKIAGPNSKYIDSKGDLQTKKLVEGKAPGYTVIKVTDNLAEALKAIEVMVTPVYVSGSGSLIRGEGDHTVNITGVPNENRILPVQGTSNNDRGRQFSLNSSDYKVNTTQVNSLTITLQTSQITAFNQLTQQQIALSSKPVPSTKSVCPLQGH